jgi:CBS-domain-containing membrane protein
MKTDAIMNAEFDALQSSHTVGDAAARMLSSRVTDLPVLSASGLLIGIVKLERVLAVLLPKAALIGDGIPDLTFVSDSLEQLRERMREIEHKTVEEFMVAADRIVHPDTPPIELVLLLYKGANNIPVVSRDTGKLVGMVSARDVLVALEGGAR